MADNMVAEVVVSGLRSSSRSIEGCNADAKKCQTEKRIRDVRDLHDDENSDVNCQKTSPGEPSNVLKLANTSKNKNSNGRH
jgi:hypothetical protein